MAAISHLLLSSALYITLALGTGSTVCPESKKAFPGDCRLFYECVPLRESAPTPASVWIPARCTAGLVFHAALMACVIPDDTWNCRGALRQPKDIYHYKGIILNALEQDSFPLSAVNSPPTDSIKKQMLHLTQLISALRSSTPLPPKKQPVPTTPSAILYKTSQAFNKQSEFPDQLNKIAAQLAMQASPPNLHQTNLNFLPLDALKYAKQNRTGYPITVWPHTNPNTEHLVSTLFQKYLANESQESQNQYYSYHQQTKDNTYPNHNQKDHTDYQKIKNHAYNKDSENYTEQISKDIAVHQQDENSQNSQYHQHIHTCSIGTRVPNPTNCTKYYICAEKRMHAFICPPNKAFSKQKQMCDVKEYKRCVKADVQPEEVLNTRGQNDSACKVHTRLPDPESTKYYFICVPQPTGEWRKIRVSCPSFMNFCSKKNQCLPSDRKE